MQSSQNENKIYKILNTENDEVFIGTTVSDLNRRLKNILCEARDPSNQSELHKLIRAIGAAKFRIELVKPNRELRAEEKKLVEKKFEKNMVEMRMLNGHLNEGDCVRQSFIKLKKFYLLKVLVYSSKLHSSLSHSQEAKQNEKLLARYEYAFSIASEFVDATSNMVIQ